MTIEWFCISLMGASVFWSIVEHVLDVMTGAVRAR